MKRNRRLAAVVLLLIFALTLAPPFAAGFAAFSIIPQYMERAKPSAGEPAMEEAGWEIPSGMEEPIRQTPPEATEPPFCNARAAAVTPTRIEAEWDAIGPGPLWVLVELWRDGEKMNSVSAGGGKASVAAAPGSKVTVTVSAGGYSESVECETPAGKSYKDYGYRRVEAYTAYVPDAGKGFYGQTRKSVKSIARDELSGNLDAGYAYGVHINFTWQRTRGEKRLSDLVVVGKAPDGRVFVEESSPKTIPGNLEGAYFAVLINNALRYFLGIQDFSYGEYEFLVYTEGRLLGYSRVTINGNE